MHVMIVNDQMSKTMRDTKEIGSMVYRYLLPLESNNTLLNKFIKMRCVPLILRDYTMIQMV